MKRSILRKIAIGAAVLTTATSLIGCSNTTRVENYAQTVVAKFGDEDIYLSEPNFFLKYNQWYMEKLYSSIYDDMSMLWQQAYGGKTVEASMKEDAMAAVLQTRILASNAQAYGVQLTEEDTTKVSEAVASFLESADTGLIAATGMTAEILTEIYTKNAIANKVWEAMVADTDTNVPDEVARQVAIDYIQVDEKEDDPEWAKREAQAMFDRAQAGETLETIAYDYDFVVNPKTLGADENIELNTKAMALKLGETALVTNGETGYYVISCTNELDEEATQKEKDTIIAARKAENFKPLYENLKAAAPKLTIVNKVWSAVNLNTKVYVPETTSAETITEEATVEETTTK